MQLQDVRTAVRHRMGLSTNDTAITDAVLSKIIAHAERKVNLMHDWPWLEATDATWTATTADQAAYTAASDLASDWRKTLSITIGTEEFPLRPKQRQDILRYSNQTGKPRFYSAQGSEIILAPKPDSAYTVVHRYVRFPDEVTVDATDVSVYDWAIDLLIEQACILTARRLRDSKMARDFTTDFATTYATMEDEVRRTRQLPTPRHRTDVGWS